MAEHIPREFIQLLLSKIDIVDFIDGRVPLRKKSSNNYFACCPFHGEKTPSFSVSQNKQFYYCFGCGAHGNALDFLMQFDRLSFPEAIESLARHAGMEIPREARRPTQPVVSADVYDLMSKVSEAYVQNLKQNPAAIQYLKDRGISGQIAKNFEIGFAPNGWDFVTNSFGKTITLKQHLHESGMLIKKDDGGYYDRFRERIMFPIRDRRGRVVGFGGRILNQGEPKYLNSPETPIFQKGHELYGLYQALQAHRQLEQILIVEGYMDVIALFQHGITYAVATLGTATTPNHIQRLFRYAPDIVFCFDGDQAGKTAAWRALTVTLPLMQDGIQVRFMFLPDGEDPDSLIRKEGKERFQQRIKEASSLSHFFFQTVSTQADLSHMDGRSRFVKLAMEHLEQLPTGMFQEMMLEELAKRARINDVKQLKKPLIPERRTSNNLTAKPPSNLRLALMLLVQQPHLSQLVEDPLPEIEGVKGYDLFQKVWSQTKMSPGITTGGLLEYWRGQEEEKTLAKIALTEHMIPEDGIKSEFLGTIQRLRKISQEQVIQRLLARAAQESLTQEEKQELTQLINNKESQIG